MEVVIFSPSASKNEKSSYKDDDDFELFLEPEYFCKKKKKDSMSLHTTFDRLAIKKNQSLRKFQKLEVLLKDKKQNDLVIENLKLIEEKEKEIKNFLIESIQQTLTDDSEFIRSKLLAYSTFDDSEYYSILSNYSSELLSSIELPLEIKSLKSLLAFNFNSEWTSIRTRLLLGACSQYMLKQGPNNGFELFTWLKTTICRYFQPSRFLSQLALSGALLRLPSIDKMVLLNLQQLCIQFYLSTCFKKNIYFPADKLDESSLIDEFTYPMIIFNEISLSSKDFLIKSSNPAFLAVYTLFLQSHFHIIQYLLELQPGCNKVKSLFSDFILEIKKPPLENAKHELCFFLKSLASRLKPGFYIRLQEIILEYETLLIK